MRPTIPLLNKPGIAGAVARAIEHFPGSDMEGYCAHAALFGEPLYGRERRTEMFARARAAERADQIAMNWQECMAESGASPAQRAEYQP